MSSLRNAVARRPHKERSQPESRQKWGLLEKHKDYSLRAKDFNQKKQKLNILAQKSREKHPDEFAFGMLREGVSQGKHGKRGAKDNRLGVDAVKLLKTQDAGYLRNVAQRTRREIERVGEEGALSKVLEKGGQEQEKVLFDEDGEPLKKRRRVLEERSDDEMFSDALEDLDEDDVNARNMSVQLPQQSTSEIKPARKVLSKKQAEKEKDRLSQLKLDRKRRKRLQELRAAKLAVLKKRQKDILAAADQLELQRAKMAGSIGGTNKNGVRFKIRERKK